MCVYMRALSLASYATQMALIGIMEIISAVIGFVILICLISYKNNGLPTNWPLIGMLPAVIVRLCGAGVHVWGNEVLEKTHLSFMFKGPWFSNMDILITADPANIHYIMSSNFSNFPKGSEFKKMFDILGDGIFNSDLDLWKSQRKLARALMHRQEFYQFLVNTTMDKVEKGLIPVLDYVCSEGLVVDFQDLIQRFTFDATCILVTGYDPRSLSVDFPEATFSNALDAAEQAIFYRHAMPETFWRFQRWLGIGEERKLREAWKTLDRLLAEIIAAKKKEFREGTKTGEDGKSDDLLTSYMQGNDDSSLDSRSSLSEDKYLRDTIINFMIAGRDTTGSALSWFFWVVSQNPQVEAKIREELKSTLPAGETEQRWLFDSENLKKLLYLHGALCETLRLYPPVPFQHKAPLKPDTLPSGHHVTPHNKILFSVYSMGRMASIWGEDCLEVKPERWITERGGIKHEPSYKFLAFNAGPRTCLGKEAAFTQMKAVAAAIIYNYNIQVVDEHNVTPGLSVILHMKHGMKVRLTKRWA